jgi:hypothetical protein
MKIKGNYKEIFASAAFRSVVYLPLAGVDP